MVTDDPSRRHVGNLDYRFDDRRPIGNDGLRSQFVFAARRFVVSNLGESIQAINFLQQKNFGLVMAPLSPGYLVSGHLILTTYTTYELKLRPTGDIHLHQGYTVRWLLQKKLVQHNFTI